MICDDTDVFALLVYHYMKHGPRCKVMEGTSAMRSVVDINTTVEKQKAIVPQVLGLHALSGHDTVAHPWGIGKATAIRVLT